MDKDSIDIIDYKTIDISDIRFEDPVKIKDKLNCD